MRQSDELQKATACMVGDRSEAVDSRIWKKITVICSYLCDNLHVYRQSLYGVLPGTDLIRLIYLHPSVYADDVHF